MLSEVATLLNSFLPVHVHVAGSPVGGCCGGAAAAKSEARRSESEMCCPPKNKNLAFEVAVKSARLISKFGFCLRELP